MVHTPWEWIVPGKMEEEERLLNNIPPTQSCSFYYTSAITVQNRKGHWKYISSLSRSWSHSARIHYIDAVNFYPKLFRSKLTWMVGNGQDTLPVTLIEEMETKLEPPSYHTEIILFQDQMTRFTTAATFKPSQLEVTYVFSLKLKDYDTIARRNNNTGRTAFWIYRRWNSNSI